MHELPQLSDVLLTLSRPTENQPLSYSQLWHLDHDDKRVCKLFIYLTDVRDTADGPLTFIPARNRSRSATRSRPHGRRQGLLRVDRSAVKEDGRAAPVLVHRQHRAVCAWAAASSPTGPACSTRPPTFSRRGSIRNRLPVSARSARNEIERTAMRLLMPDAPGELTIVRIGWVVDHPKRDLAGSVLAAYQLAPRAGIRCHCPDVRAGRRRAAPRARYAGRQLCPRRQSRPDAVCRGGLALYVLDTEGGVLAARVAIRRPPWPAYVREWLRRDPVRLFLLGRPAAAAHSTIARRCGRASFI